jgi:hypothetical protein
MLISQLAKAIDRHPELKETKFSISDGFVKILFSEINADHLYDVLSSSEMGSLNPGNLIDEVLGSGHAVFPVIFNLSNSFNWKVVKARPDKVLSGFDFSEKQPFALEGLDFRGHWDQDSQELVLSSNDEEKIFRLKAQPKQWLIEAMAA